MKLVNLVILTLALSCSHSPPTKKDEHIVGGFYSQKQPLSFEENIKLSNILIHNLEELGLENIQGPEKLKEILGDEYEKILTAFGEQNDMHAHLKNIQTKYPTLRGVIWVRLEGDDLIYDRDQSKVSVVDKAKKISRYKITTLLSRELLVWAEFFDLRSLKSTYAWGDKLTKSNEITYESDLVDDQFDRFFRSIKLSMGQLFRTYKPDPEDEFIKRFPYPSPPENKDVLAPALIKYSKNLIKELDLR